MPERFRYFEKPHREPGIHGPPKTVLFFAVRTDIDMKCFRLSALLLFVAGQTFGQSIRQFCDSVAAAAVAAREVPGISIAVVRGSEVYSGAYGYANFASRSLVDSTTLFQLGSVGKLITAIAVLQQVERGKLDLHADVNKYLTGFKVPESYPAPVTLFHLLTHTAGFNDRIIGYGARSASDIQPLGEHLREFLPSRQMEPGKEINYSNYSYALAGYIVERVSGQVFTDYVALNVFDRLGMSHSMYVSPSDDSNASVGYTHRDTTFAPATTFVRHAVPAGSLISCQSDMTKLLHELLNPTGQLLTDASRKLLFARQFTQHPLLPGYSLGLEEQSTLGIHGFAKGGSVPGYLSAIAFYPDLNLGLFVATNTSDDGFMERFVPAFLQKFGIAGKGNLLHEVPVDLAAFAGTFSSNRTNNETIEELPWLFRGEFKTWVTDGKYLSCYHNGTIQNYIPVEPLVFQNTNHATEYLVFGRNASREIESLYRNVNIGGFGVPQSLFKVKWYDDPEFINEYYAVVLLVVGLFVLILPVRGFIWLRRRSKPAYFKDRLLPVAAVWAGLITAVLFVFHFVNGVLYLFRHAEDLYFGVPPELKTTQYLTYLFPLLIVVLALLSWYTWSARKGSLFARLYFALVVVAAGIHVVFLYRWNFIGLNF